MKKGDALVALLVLALTGCKIIIPETTSPAPSAARPSSPVSAELVSVAKLINDYRRSVGCPALVWNPVVAKAAQAHSDDMVRRNYFSHNTPEGLTSGMRLDKAGVRWSRVAENIAAGQRTAREVYSSWIKSPGHRANIANCALREHGIGLTRGKESLPYGTVNNAWTHDFVTLKP